MITLRSPGFEHGQAIPVKYSQDGENLSPPLRWQGAPAETAAFALVVDDPDAPTDEPWVHWVLYDIPAGEESLPEGVRQGAEPSVPSGARQGRNTSGHLGYDGPAPPRGHGTHHYHFKLYALDEAIEPAGEVDKIALLASIRGHVLDEGELIGTYRR
jgi:hypothetical protein